MPQSPVLYRDINLNFFKHPSTGDITTINGVDAIKSSIRNLIFTNHYERYFNPEIGCSVRNLLFEQINPITANVVIKDIEDIFKEHEPRAILQNVQIIPRNDINKYELYIEFTVSDYDSGVQVLEISV